MINSIFIIRVKKSKVYSHILGFSAFVFNSSLDETFAVWGQIFLTILYNHPSEITTPSEFAKDASVIDNFGTGGFII